MASDSRRRARQKGRSTSGRFLAVPHYVIQSPGFRDASPRVIKLLMVIGAQFNGANNGALKCPRKAMHEAGVGAAESLHHALHEAQHYGLLVCTRHGGRGIGRSLFALGWLPIDPCTFTTLEVAATQGACSQAWKVEQPEYTRERKIQPVRKVDKDGSTNEPRRFGTRTARSGEGSKVEPQSAIHNGAEGSNSEHIYRLPVP